MSEPGSYDELDLSEFSQEDFDRLDVAIAQTYAEEQQITSLKGWLKESNGGPALQVELEDSSDHATPSFSVSQVPAPDSPYVRHRSWRNALTVTDLTSPQWCVEPSPFAKASSQLVAGVSYSLTMAFAKCDTFV
jgi:hypothetical protein